MLSELAAYARDPSGARLARQCEGHMGVGIATYGHFETGRLAGSYSRACRIDTIGYPHLIHALRYLVFGEAVFANPVADR